MDLLTKKGQMFGNIAEKMYTDRMTIRRQTTTKGPAGGNIPGAPLILASNVPCRIKPASANERELAGATQGANAYLIKSPAWQGSELIQIDATCEIVIAARDIIPEQILKVIAPLSNQGLTIEVVGTKTV